MSASIAAVTAIEEIRVEAADQEIIAATAFDVVVAEVAEETIVCGVANQGVGTFPSFRILHRPDGVASSSLNAARGEVDRRSLRGNDKHTISSGTAVE